MAGKADRLRERLTIDPDDTSVPQQPAQIPASVSTAPAAERERAANSGPESEANTFSATAPGGHTSDSVHAEEMPTALDDPALLAGRKAYRSFYVDDLAFGRFRAAIYWVARRQDAVGKVPENMSVAINDAMISIASELENMFNAGNIFPPTPEQRKPKRAKPK